MNMKSTSIHDERVSGDGLLAHSTGEIEANPVSAETLAYRHILSRIRAGLLVPGARVRTEDVANEIGMSRQPVREAIRRLEAQGYVTSRPNRGAMVSKYTPDQLLELFEIRAALEGLAMRLALSRVQQEDFLEIDKLLASLDSAGTETGLWLEWHDKFHKVLCALSGRPRLVHEIARMNAALEPYMRLWFLHTGVEVDAGSDHAPLVNALRSGYPGHAEQVMRDHILETAPMIITYLEGNKID